MSRRIRFAHLNIQGIDIAVFDADTIHKTNTARSGLLSDLTCFARKQGLRISKSALAFSECGRIQFYGSADLVRYLSSNGVPCWTHTLTA